MPGADDIEAAAVIAVAAAAAAAVAPGALGCGAAAAFAAVAPEALDCGAVAAAAGVVPTQRRRRGGAQHCVVVCLLISWPGDMDWLAIC